MNEQQCEQYLVDRGWVKTSQPLYTSSGVIVGKTDVFIKRFNQIDWHLACDEAVTKQQEFENDVTY